MNFFPIRTCVFKYVHVTFLDALLCVGLSVCLFMFLFSPNCPSVDLLILQLLDIFFDLVSKTSVRYFTCTLLRLKGFALQKA